MRNLIIICIIALLTACSTTSQLCSVPEAENSTLCELAQKLKTSPEAMSQSLLIANFGALESDLYTAQAADDFVEKIIEDIEELRSKGATISYIEAIRYIDNKFRKIPPKAQAVFLIINPAGLFEKDINLPLTDYDYGLLLNHLEKQKAIIKVYL